MKLGASIVTLEIIAAVGFTLGWFGSDMFDSLLSPQILSWAAAGFGIAAVVFAFSFRWFEKRSPVVRQKTVFRQQWRKLRYDTAILAAAAVGAALSASVLKGQAAAGCGLASLLVGATIVLLSWLEALAVRTEMAELEAFCETKLQHDALLSGLKPQAE